MRLFRESSLVMLAAFAGALLATAWLPNLAPLNHNYAWIAQSYADNLRAGFGPVFNPGERVLLTVTPGYLLLLALFPANLWTATAAALSAGCLYRLVRVPADKPAALLMALIVVIVWPWGVGTPYPLLAALYLLGIEAAVSARWGRAGMIFGLALLFGPETLLIGLAAGLIAAQAQSGWRFFGPVVGIGVLTLLGLWAYYGDGLAGVLLLQYRTARLPDSFVLMLAILFGIGAFNWLRRAPAGDMAVILAGAVMVTALLVRMIGQDGGAAACLPLIGVGLLLAARPVWAEKRLDVAAPVLLAAALIVTVTLANQPSPALITLPADAPSAGAWRAGGLGSRAPGQNVIALDGSLQPELRRMLDRNDRNGVLVRYAPAAILPGGDSESLDSETLRRLGYVPAENGYVRTNRLGEFRPLAVEREIGLDMALTGAALDDADARPDGTLRIRLDWRISRPSAYATRMVFSLRRDSEAQTVLIEEIAANVLQKGALSTYHALRLGADESAGRAALWLTVGINRGTVGKIPLGEVQIAARAAGISLCGANPCPAGGASAARGE